MAKIFHYGPYLSTGYGPLGGLPPGAEEYWSFGPWPWFWSAVAITAHPFSSPGLDRTLEVTSISSRVSPTGDHFIYCTVRNVGIDPVNYAVWLGGVAP